MNGFFDCLHFSGRSSPLEGRSAKAARWGHRLVPLRAVRIELRAARHSAVDHHRLPGDEFRIVAGEIKRHPRDILRMPRARNRLRLRHELFHRFFHAGLIAMEYGSVDSAWADTVDA